MFHYTSHIMKRFKSHVHREQPLNGFENGVETGRKSKRTRCADNLRWKFYLLLSEPGSARCAKVAVKWAYKWNFLRNKEKKHISFESNFCLVEGVRTQVTAPDGMNAKNLLLGSIRDEF